jgi:hypothetical protein
VAKKYLIHVLNNSTAMEKAKLIELALGLAAIGAILIGGFVLAYRSHRASSLPKVKHH